MEYKKMGETSKTSGEIGEKIAKKLLEEMGWSKGETNISINCTNPLHRNKSDNPKQTHGIDLVFIYDSPFHDDTTEIAYVSVKNSIRPPKANSGLISDFKSHIKDLSEAISCAKNSPEINEMVDSFQAKKRIKHNGILIWTHCDEDHLEVNLRPQLSKIRVPDEVEYPIYLIDNERASFLIQTINHAKSKHPNSDINFYYPKIGTSIYDEQDRYGKLLPIEIACSDIIPLKITKSTSESNTSVEISIYANQNFEKETYQKLLSYAYSFSAGLCSSISLGTKDYNESSHQRDANTSKLKFDKKTEKVSPFSFGSPFLELLN